MKTSKLRSLILALEDNPQGISVLDLSDRTRLMAGTVSVALLKMERDGAVESFWDPTTTEYPRRRLYRLKGAELPAALTIEQQEWWIDMVTSEVALIDAHFFMRRLHLEGEEPVSDGDRLKQVREELQSVLPLWAEWRSVNADLADENDKLRHMVDCFVCGAPAGDPCDFDTPHRRQPEEIPDVPHQ